MSNEGETKLTTHEIDLWKFMAQNSHLKVFTQGSITVI